MFQHVTLGSAGKSVLVIALTFAAPAFARPLALSAAIPIMPLVLLVLFALVVRRAISENRSPRVGERIAA